MEPLHILKKIRELWNSLKTNHTTWPWLIAGDLNAIKNPLAKIGKKAPLLYSRASKITSSTSNG